MPGGYLSYGIYQKLGGEREFGAFWLYLGLPTIAAFSANHRPEGVDGGQHRIDRGDGSRGEHAPHFLTSRRPRRWTASLSFFMLLCCAAAAPTPATCEDWAAHGECTNNPSFMWSECAAACKSRGLAEPWAKLDAQALAAPPANASTLELSFSDGGSFTPLRIVLREDISPQTVAAVVAAVGERREGAVAFYRNEAVPTSPPGQCGSILCGPYSLVQGRLAALSNTPTEGQPMVRRGHVARIQNGADFFIALDDHSEWGHAFT
eukprot:1936490-Prymnesium_polylepis.1